MENEVPFLSGTSGCASWRPLASAHGRTGTQSRAEPHLVLSDCHYCASTEATLRRVPACCIEPCGDSRLAWEDSVIWLSLHTSGRGSEAAQFLLITRSLCPWNKSKVGPQQPAALATSALPQGPQHLPQACLSLRAPCATEEAAGRAWSASSGYTCMRTLYRIDRIGLWLPRQPSFGFILSCDITSRRSKNTCSSPFLFRVLCPMIHMLTSVQVSVSAEVIHPRKVLICMVVVFQSVKKWVGIWSSAVL